MAKFGETTFGSSFGGGGNNVFGTAVFGDAVFGDGTVVEPPDPEIFTLDPGLNRDLARAGAIRPVTWTIDGEAVEVSGNWHYTSRENWGFETAEIEVPLVYGLKPTRATASAWVDSSRCVWEGKITSPPAVVDMVATYQLEGNATDIEHMVDRVLMQNRDLSQWVQMSSEPHDYNDNDHISCSVNGGKMQFEIPKDGDIASGNRGGFVFWAPECEITSVAFTVNIGNNGPQGRLRIYGAQGPDGTLHQIGADIVVGTPGKYRVRTNAAYDLIALVFESTTATSPNAKRFFWLSNLRVNGLTASDDATTQDVAEILGGLAGFDVDGVQPGAVEVLPFDYTGSHAEALTTAALSEGWRWIVLEDRGKGPYLDFGPYEKTYLAFLEQGVLPDLDPAPLYDKVVVAYELFNGARQTASARPDVDPLPDGHSELLMELDEPVHSPSRARQQAQVQVDYLSTYRVEGQVDIYALVDLDTGEPIPVHYLQPGCLLLIADYDPMLPPQRVVAIDGAIDHVSASLTTVPRLMPRIPAKRFTPPQSVHVGPKPKAHDKGD